MRFGDLNCPRPLQAKNDGWAESLQGQVREDRELSRSSRIEIHTYEAGLVVNGYSVEGCVHRVGPEGDGKVKHLQTLQL